MKNKTIALIGPAPHITEIDQKDYINSFDLVIRVNKALPIPKKVKEKTGDRCDILYICKKIMPHKEWDNLKEIKLKTNAIWGNYLKRDFHKKYKDKIDLVHPKFQYGFSFKKPNTGFMAMAEILSEGPREFYITGFTFFQGKPYYDGYRGLTLEKEVEKHQGNLYNHEQKPQLEYFKKHIYPYVKCDKVLKDICE